VVLRFGTMLREHPFMDKEFNIGNQVWSVIPILGKPVFEKGVAELSFVGTFSRFAPGTRLIVRWPVSVGCIIIIARARKG